MQKNNWWCTCKKDNKSKKNLHKKYYRTVVCDEGICLHCGYYALYDKSDRPTIHETRKKYSENEDLVEQETLYRILS